MAYSGQPVSLTAGTAQGSFAPLPLVLVGGTPAATATVNGGVKKAANIAQVGTTFADLAAATTAYNNLLTALKNAGIMTGP